MKKLLLSFTLLIGYSLSCHAQTNQGNLILGGQIFYASSNENTEGSERSYRTSILPNIGYLLADNIALGLGIGYENEKNSYGISGASNKSEYFVISPFGRIYVPLAENFKFFGHIAVPMRFGESTESQPSADVTRDFSRKIIGLNLSPGFAFFPGSKIGLEFALNGLEYSNRSVEDHLDEEVKSESGETFSIGTNFFSPRVGIHFYF
jgi:hypothetical protein